MAKKRLSLGVKRVLAWLVNSSGYAAGAYGDTLSTSTVAGAYVLQYPKTVNYSVADAPTAEQTGGELRIANVIVGDRPLEPFTIETADMDSTFYALSTGGAVDTTNSTIERWSSNSANDNPPVMGLAIQEYFYEPGRTGRNSKYWITTVIPSCTVEPKRPTATERAFGTNTYRVVPTYSGKDFTGMAFSASARMNPTDGILDHYFYATDNPWHVVTYKVANTSAPSILLPYRPLSSTITLNATQNEAWRNGTIEALTTMDTGTYTATGAAGAANDMLVIAYSTNFVAS